MVSELPTAIAREWSRDLPRDFARTLAHALAVGPDAVRALRPVAALPSSRKAVEDALAIAELGRGAFLGGLLLGRLEATGEQPTVTPVWTGPESAAAPTRLTVAVVADLVDSASTELILVSYATHPSADVRASLERAVARRVDVTLLLERPEDNPQFHGVSDPFPGLAARRLCWPAAVRPSGASMHAKILVVDRRIALIGSANLTGMAMLHNLECGLLVRGGGLPDQVAQHLLAGTGLTTHQEC